MKSFVKTTNFLDDASINTVGGGTRGIHDDFEVIVGLENLFLAWGEFRRGKSARPDVQQFELHLEDNIFAIHEQLQSQTYRPAHYSAFYVKDPKLRHIHKATVTDRLVHHALFRILYPIFDKTFIYDSYSCRIGKGTHVGVVRLEKFLKNLNRNNKKPVWAMKCDIKKFFDSVNHQILKSLIIKKVFDPNTLWLINSIIDSFKKATARGLPLGNVTSQLFANIYLNELDQFVKRKLKAQYYLRYCDDFIFLSNDKNDFKVWYRQVAEFLKQRLGLSIHEHKTVIKKYRQGVDFLGYVLLPNHRVLRTKTKRRIFKKFKGVELSEFSMQTYLGVLKHCNGYNLKKKFLTSVPQHYN